MAVQPERSVLEAQVRHVASLRREAEEKSRQLSELDMMLADYHAERARLIRDLRRLRARLRDIEEQSHGQTLTPNSIEDDDHAQ